MNALFIRKRMRINTNCNSITVVSVSVFQNHGNVNRKISWTVGRIDYYNVVINLVV